MSVILLCLRVSDCDVSDWIDLPELESINLYGYAFEFGDDAASVISMRSAVVY